MDITLIIEDAVANPIKFTLDSEPSDVRANFDQRRYAQVKNATVDDEKHYEQKFEKTDVIRIEFYSNFPLNRVNGRRLRRCRLRLCNVSGRRGPISK